MLRTTTRIRRRAAAAASAVALCTLLVTACSHEPTAAGSKGGALPGNAQAQDDDRAVKHRACLRAHGIEIADPKPGEEGIAIAGGDQKTFEAAAKACSSTAGGGGANRPSQADQDALVRYAQCMRKNGVNIPDPEPGMAMPAQKADKKFEKAQAACQKELPQGGADQSDPKDTGR
jgi:hypothetical protein